jgi:S-adenosylmethionine:tRNA ribosyltransferase-isomerase
MLKTSDFDYNFPEELIAHEPAKERDNSRLMVLNRANRTFEHRHFHNIIDYLIPGDLLVLNNTKVIPANLVGIKEEGGAKVEVLLVSRRSSLDNKQIWLCLVRPGKRLKVGSKVVFANGRLTGTVVEKLDTGEQLINFESQEDFWKVIHNIGEVPLPPYINPKSENRNPKSRFAGSRIIISNMESGQIRNPKSQLSKRYQTVFAKNEGASAAPTAGLHFTPQLLEKIKAKGINIAYLTLHTGLATFQPVRTENIEDHVMHAEYFEVKEETVKAIQKAKRVIAVGTTVVRTLETIFASKTQRLKGESNLFIYPGYQFKVVNALITNFHWPKSTLIMLVCAFAGRDFIMQAYREAIQKKYRFFSFGDATLII